MRTRVLLGAAGLAAMGVGVSILLTDRYIHRPIDVVWWLVGADLLHETVVVPLVLAVGALLRPRGALRAGLVSAACVAAVAVPVLLAPRSRTNPTVLPLDYPRDLLITLAVIAALTVLARTWTALRSRRRAATAGSGSTAADRTSAGEEP